MHIQHYIHHTKGAGLVAAWVMSVRLCHNHMHSFMIFVYSYRCPTGQKLGSPYLQALR